MAISSPVDSGASSPVDSGAGQQGVDKDLHDVSHLVHEEFDEHLDPRAVDECLSKVSSRFDNATVRAFVPLLVRRYAREELLGRLKQAPADQPPRQVDRQLSQ